ncbi:glycosyltransferase [Nocardioides zeae]
MAFTLRPPRGHATDGPGAQRGTVRIAVVTESFYPATDGTTTTVRNLVDRLVDRGHTVRLVAPAPGLTSYRGSRSCGCARSTSRAARCAPRSRASPPTWCTSPRRSSSARRSAARRSSTPAVSACRRSSCSRPRSATWPRRCGRRRSPSAPTACSSPPAGCRTGSPPSTSPPTCGHRASTPRPSPPRSATRGCTPRGRAHARAGAARRGGVRRRAREGPRRTPPAGRRRPPGRAARRGRPGLAARLARPPAHRRRRERRKAGGALAAGDLATAMASLDVLVHPGGQLTCAHALREAAASGVPVVAARTGGARDVVHHLESGLLVDVTDPRALTDAVAAVAADRHRGLMGAHGRGLAEQRTWRDAVDELLGRHYADLVGPAPLAAAG